jgi:hypothetical protein
MSNLKRYRIAFRIMLKRRIKERFNSIINYASIEELAEIFDLFGKLERNQLNKVNNDEVILFILKEDDELFKRLAQ